MLDEITECITHTNQQLHDCYTITGGRNMQSCKPTECPEKEYIHNCVKCYPVAAVCETCQARLHYPPGDPNRGDRFIRGAPIGSWMCPLCGAMELDVDEQADKSVQTTLEGF